MSDYIHGMSELQKGQQYRLTERGGFGFIGIGRFLGAAQQAMRGPEERFAVFEPTKDYVVDPTTGEVERDWDLILLRPEEIEQVVRSL